MLVLTVIGGIWRAPQCNWDLGLFAVLLAFSVFSDLTAVSTESKVKVSGSFLALVVAMVFLGGTPAAVIGVATILTGWLRWRDEWHYLLNNLLTYALFPLVGGIVFKESITALGLTASDPSFYLCVFALFQLALALNFLLIASYGCYVERSSFSTKLRVLLRSKQLASFQVGMLSAMLRTLDLRDQMTARHSAAVARYSRAIAQRAGYSRREEELVHIAALLHDIGKFILPDRILKANVPLTDEDWMLIKRHPQQGARVVSSLDGYGPVAEIILAHHERIDGKGYPRGLAGDEIPELARIISVADTYDVMTARDSYRTPMSSYDAIAELRRVAGKQLDARFVEVFIELLEGKDVSFQHGEAADFEKELALEARIAETASPEGERSRFQVAGVSA